MQQLAQRTFGFEGNLALPDPFQYGVAPLPVLDETEVLFRQVDGQIHTAAVRVRSRHWSDHIVAVHDVFGHADDPP